MVISKILNYQKHIKTIFRPIIDAKIKFLRSGLNNTGIKNNIIISLTTYGNRLKDIKYTLYSLFSQSLKPDKIVLWLDYSFDNNYTFKLLKKFIDNGLEIKFTKDIGPYTKLIPALKEYPDAIIVTADDDIYYINNWLEKLYNSYIEDKSSIHCHRAHKIKISGNTILPYEKWNKQVISRGNAGYNYFLTGVGGVLYPPKIFSNEVFNEDKFLTLTPKADDIWFWGMAVLNGVKIRPVQNNTTTLKSTNILRQLNLLKEKTLYNYNENGGNDKQLNNLLLHYPQIKEKLVNENKVSLIFDITTLHAYNQKSGHRAGVFNAALNILLEFISDNHFEITFYTDYKYYYFLKKVAAKHFPDIKFINIPRFYERVLGYILYKFNSLSPKLMYLSLYVLRCIDGLFPLNHKLYSEINQFDAYFTPFDGISKEFSKSTINKYQFIHDVIPLLENKKLPPYHWANSVFKNITNDVFYFTNSEYTKKDFLKQFPYISPERVKTAYLGCTPQEIKNIDIYSKYGIPANKKYILSLCSLGKRKNLKFAAENFLTFISRNNINDLVMVLAGGVWQSYKNELKQLTSNKNIIFTGYIDDEDIPALYSNAFCFIYPSLYEGFGLPVLEAMTYGCPVIASNRTSIPEICRNSAILINPVDNEDILKAFKLIFSNPNIRQELIIKANDTASLFTWSKTFNIINQEILNHVKKQN